MRQPPSTYCTFGKACSRGNFLWFISCNSLHSSQLDSKGGTRNSRIFLTFPNNYYYKTQQNIYKSQGCLKPLTPLNQVGVGLSKLCPKILRYASYQKVSRFSGSRKFLSHWKPQYLLCILSENIRFSKAFNNSRSDCAVQCQITHILLEICQ